MTAAARWAAAVVLGALASGLAGASAVAHPLDETLQQVYVTPSRTGLDVELVVTPGVLVAPAFVRSLDTDGDRALSVAETSAHVRTAASTLRLRVDGAVVPLTVTGHAHSEYALLAAGGGTVTLEATAPLPAGARNVVLTDGYRPGRTAVQMDVLVAKDDPVGAEAIIHADGGRTLALTLVDKAAAPVVPAEPVATDGSMLDALRKPLTSPWAMVALVGVCALLGAFHALTPGHGKALLASYLVGSESTPKQAIQLGAVITVTHTAAVILLGAAVLAAGRYVVPGLVVPVLEAVVGVVVVVLGVRLLARRRRTGPEPAHPHHHHHAHSHGGGVGTLVAPEVRTLPTTFRGLATMGVAGGVVPCPEALSVLLLAIGLNRTALGLTMIVAFSVGLAAVLVGLGLALVTARSAVTRFRPRGLSWLPVVSAVVVTALGAAMVIRGVAALAG
ncbi:nickel/cobalt transporter [Cryptosporangium aurantiacum]|uniref:ABC-type nickel/cobalt efflux system, permease component RcnA n=1 Tax=Cryptosporangium aurantiacum TaxID=134849 RepID=A0A1M7QSZ1_9ACTN|nr:sulfite exporter TauE/SafE family protein [Cryptosporangium aurantiacum]SHN34541.1 ABC-type nickel/cobalt efflux system, permease component RcnA [Cryptosporangium aurantiacum]